MLIFCSIWGRGGILHFMGSIETRNDISVHSLDSDENLARAWGWDGQIGDQRNVVQQFVGAIQLANLEQTQRKEKETRVKKIKQKRGVVAR